MVTKITLLIHKNGSAWNGVTLFNILCHNWNAKHIQPTTVFYLLVILLLELYGIHLNELGSVAIFSLDNGVS